MTTLSAESVERIRGSIARAHEVTAGRFRDAFAQGEASPALYRTLLAEALLEAVVYTRATEERIERRQLILDTTNELHYHGRELLAEGRGGVGVR